MSLLEVIKKAAANPDELTSESNYPIVLNPDQILLSLKPQDEASNDATLIKRVQGWTISETDSEIIDSSKNFFKKLKRKLKNPNSFGKDEFVGMLNSYLKKNSDRVGISVGAESSGEDYTRKLIEKAGFLMGREVKGLVLEACTVLELWELLKTLIVHGLVETSASSSLVYNLIEKRRSDLVCLCVKKLPNLQTSTILSIFRYFLSPPKAAHGSMLTVKNGKEEIFCQTEKEFKTKIGADSAIAVFTDKSSPACRDDKMVDYLEGLPGTFNGAKFVYADAYQLEFVAQDLKLKEDRLPAVIFYKQGNPKKPYYFSLQNKKKLVEMITNHIPKVENKNEQEKKTIIPEDENKNEQEKKTIIPEDENKNKQEKKTIIPEDENKNEQKKKTIIPEDENKNEQEKKKGEDKQARTSAGTTHPNPVADNNV